jgi:peptidoglycan/LPS O-acetylase OafA/YrhL
MFSHLDGRPPLTAKAIASQAFAAIALMMISYSNLGSVGRSGLQLVVGSGAALIALLLVVNLVREAFRRVSTRLRGRTE